mmetsp:Transcript_5318/g.12155  ORF Transcript_5318/g.12155 Transcript_5318/m.12155 type:complete len:401 (+) Transcript_5318:99-1301(+)
MSTASMDMRISAIFIMIVAASAGVMIPFVTQKQNGGMEESASFKCLKALGAGVMIGVALCHLLKESEHDLHEVQHDYTLSFALCGLGIIITLTMEQGAIIYLSSLNTNGSKGAVGGSATVTSNAGSDRRGEIQLQHQGVDEHGEHCGFVKCEHVEDDADEVLKYSQTGPVGQKDVEGGVHVHAHLHQVLPGKGKSVDSDGEHAYAHVACHAHEEQEMVNKLLSTKTMQQTVALYAMEISISIHSVIIGLDIGLSTGSNSGQMAALISLVVAIAFHQFVEGVGLGAVLCDSTTARAAKLNSGGGLAHYKLAMFASIFVLSLPIGIIAGILSSGEEETPGQVGFRGAANAVASGSLLYIGLAEMAAPYFSDPELNTKPGLKVCMLALFSAGMGAMALLGYWA